MNQQQAIEFVNNYTNSIYDPKILLEVLATLDDAYFNDVSLVDDNQYDQIKKLASKHFPTHPLIIGTGSDVRGGKVKLPYKMLGLNQIEEGQIQNWITKENLKDEYIVVSEKMDGCSVQLIFDQKGNPQISYSRGNGMEGADTFRLISKLTTYPQNVGSTLAIRAEAEMSNASFEYLKDKVMSSNGKPYKNPRNMMSGLLNSEDVDPIIYNYIDLIAYTILNHEHLDVMSKSAQLEYLKDLGFKVPYFEVLLGKDITTEYLEHFILRAKTKGYEIDGAVLDIDSAKLRKTKSECSVKYKVNGDLNSYIATVTGITWNISQHGFLKPTIQYTPFELEGVTITNTTGYNARYIYDNKIQPGAKILVCRAGSVIPNPIEIIEAGPLN